MSRLPHGLLAGPLRGRLRRNLLLIFAFMAILAPPLFDVGDLAVGRISAEQVQQQPNQAGTATASKSENVSTPPSTPAGGTAAKSNGAAGENQPASGSRTGEQSNITVRVQVVNVPVSVLDRRGHLVIDLAQKDFELYEDGKPQSIKYFFRGSRPPLRIGLIVDTSNSARRKLQFEQDAASEFVFEMLQGRTSQNQIFLQTFDATSSVLQELTNDPEKLNDKIRDLKAGDHVVVGVEGIRTVRNPESRDDRGESSGTHEFSFMGAGVSSERRVELVVEQIAWELGRLRQQGGKVVVVAGPVVVHTGVRAGRPLLRRRRRREPPSESVACHVASVRTDRRLVGRPRLRAATDADRASEPRRGRSPLRRLPLWAEARSRCGFRASSTPAPRATGPWR